MMLSHYLKLYEEGQSAQTSAAHLSTKPVVRETYDELVLWEPTEAYYRRVHGAVQYTRWTKCFFVGRN